MVTVFVPTMLQPLTGGVKQVDVEARNVRQLVNGLDELYPGMKDRLVEAGQIRSNLAVSIDGEIARLGLMERLNENSEVHFVPAIGGGNSADIRADIR
ncbi:MAG: MoaD/ThiS family protein [Chloroflexi bacterium]|nr:MoaD/ThiS family protein [Chloroflexota bacterium]MDA1219114.1 MoaD/ThiS family protein [Chloroflexota bacterium]